MAKNVTILGGTTTLDIPPQRVIDGLKGRKFDRLLVIGFEEGDPDIYCASHTGDIGAMLLLMERAKDHLLNEGEIE